MFFYLLKTKINELVYINKRLKYVYLQIKFLIIITLVYIFSTSLEPFY